jgi:hypothetical protein
LAALLLYVDRTMNAFPPIGYGSTAVQNAQLGISRGMTNLARDQQLIASGGSGDITDALVDAQQQKLDVEASVKALSITDQTLGTLLDIKA